MENGNKAKADLLGMPFGTASGRLRKMLLFQFAQELDKDVCYRCKERIESIDQFSIEHTVSWFFSSTPRKTFFDLTKIAFSHLVCNISAGRINPKTGQGVNKGIPSSRKRKIRADGTLWCTHGKHFQSVELFGKDTDTYLGYKAVCSPCRKERYRLGLPR